MLGAPLEIALSRARARLLATLLTMAKLWLCDTFKKNSAMSVSRNHGPVTQGNCVNTTGLVVSSFAMEQYSFSIIAQREARICSWYS